jgi:hypothetical protein
VTGAICGIAVAGLLERIGLPILVSLALGLVPLVVGAMIATSLAARASRAAAAPASVHSVVDRSYARDWSRDSQLGYDPEQVISRKTGARI